jgi:hypothetical protein
MPIQKKENLANAIDKNIDAMKRGATRPVSLVGIELLEGRMIEEEYQKRLKEQAAPKPAPAPSPAASSAPSGGVANIDFSKLGEKKSMRKKILLYGGIGFGVVAILLTVILLRRKKS